MASEQFSLCWDNFHKNMSSGMNSLLENEDLVDVTLAVEGKCLKAHKMVLSVCSPYFKELFKSNPCQHPIVFMKDVSYVALSDLLQFMYQGEVQVSQENLTTFIKTAEALQIKGLTGDGNGSADTDIVETPHEKPVHQIEEYKPVPRQKKPAPMPAQTATVKRPRLSVSSSDSQPLPPAVAKTEPITSTPSGAATEPPVQFKMEPYDQSQSLIDETGDENFGDDNLDDTNVDDTEEYSMMEGSVGEEEPQAGTSTDGAGEGQEDKIFLRMGVKKLPQNGIVVGGFTYHQNTTKKNSKMRYLVCSEYKRLICKARAVLPVGGSVDDLVLRKEHNHPPYHEASVRDMFIREIKCSIVNQPFRPLKQLYEDVSIIYLGCAEHIKSGCRGRATIPVGGSITQLKVTQPHNHPPDVNAEEKYAFIKELKIAVRSSSMENATLKKVYETVAEVNDSLLPPNKFISTAVGPGFVAVKTFTTKAKNLATIDEFSPGYFHLDQDGKYLKVPHGRHVKMDLDDGFLYYKQKQFKDKLYLRCAVNSDVNCKASYVISVEDGVPNVDLLKCIVPHNHPPDEMAVQTEKFLDQLKKAVEVMDYYPPRKIYNIVVEGYPELAKFCPYKLVARRMRYWGKIDKSKTKLDYSDDTQ